MIIPKWNPERSFLPLRTFDEQRPLPFLTPYPQQLRTGRGMVNLRRGRIYLAGTKEQRDSTDRMRFDLWDLVQKLGRSHRRRPRVCIWADHGGRPVPERIRDKVVVQPWITGKARNGISKGKFNSSAEVENPPF